MKLATHTEIYTELLKRVESVCNPSKRPFIVKGTPLPKLADYDEWVCFELLSKFSAPTEKAVCVNDVYDIQITLYSKHAEFRSDKSFTAIYKMVDEFNEIFNQASFYIKTSCIRFEESKIVHMDLRSLSDFAKAIYQNSPPMQTLAAVIINQGTIIDTKE
jgi:hypothetical protein